jgi:hypothetical protein
MHRKRPQFSLVRTMLARGHVQATIDIDLRKQGRVRDRSCNMSDRSELTASCLPRSDDLSAKTTKTTKTWDDMGSTSKTSVNNKSSAPSLHRCSAVARCSLPLFADMSTCI